MSIEVKNYTKLNSDDDRVWKHGNVKAAAILVDSFWAEQGMTLE